MKSRKPTFKPYHQQQLMALPPSLDDLIPAHHPVRIVSHIVDRIDIKPLMKKYKACGCSSYHPRMMLKVLVYGYLNNLYSSRKLEAATRENIHFMWLASMVHPDHNTINRFRGERLKDVIKTIFSQVVLLMVESGHVDLQQVYTDGTKIESVANRYTFVWGKAIKRSKERIAQQLEELWNYTQEVASQELQDTSPVDFTEVDSQQVKDTIEKIDQALKGKPVAPKVKQKLNYARKKWPDKLDEYESKEAILDGRNSYSKTDPDATFMRMKEDHMLNGQLKPAYNTQISTHDQFIVHYSIHQNLADTMTLKPHLESFQQAYGWMPGELIADAGYGSEQNYELMDHYNIEAYVKDNYFDQSQKSKVPPKRAFHVDYLYYNKDKNCYYCPMGQVMHYIGDVKEKTRVGYIRELSRYQAANCSGCPLRGACHKSKGNRIVEVSHKLLMLRTKARENLLSEKGIAHRKKRPVDVEPVFGMIKHNRGFKRFLTRGLEKVSVEFGLLAIAHNLLKLCTLANLSPFSLKNMYYILLRLIERLLHSTHYSTSQQLFIPVSYKND